MQYFLLPAAHTRSIPIRATMRLPMALVQQKVMDTMLAPILKTYMPPYSKIPIPDSILQQPVWALSFNFLYRCPIYPHPLPGILEEVLK